ncbi:MAG: hypothetical protein ACRCXZ_09770 [Patescibacteria group bacterium]
MNKLTKFFTESTYLFKASRSFQDLKRRWGYLKSETTLLSPITISGIGSDKVRSRLNNSLRNPIITYNLDENQNVQLFALNELEIKEKIRTKGAHIWFITHGFADGFDEDFVDIANILIKYNPNDIVIGLDWSSIAIGLSPALSVDVHRAATWIKPISQQVFERLDLWGLDEKTNINFVGHSLGSLLCAEIALRYKEKYNEKANIIIALDPPSELTAKLYNQTSFLVNLTPLEKRIDSFADVSKHSLSLVGYNSIAGNQELALTAKHSYLIKFNDFRELRNGHFWVIRFFEKFLQEFNVFDELEGFYAYLQSKSLIMEGPKSKTDHSAIINLTDKKWYTKIE